MSIVTLKRKTQAQYNNISSSPNGFSLNGTHRNQGYVGQTNLSRHFTYTHMHGGYPVGHGGCCNTAPNKMQLPCVTSLENTKVVKPSTLNTSGLISTKYRWIRRGQPFSTVKPNANNQADYITKLKKTALSACNISKKNGVVFGSSKYLPNFDVPTKSGVFSNHCRICISNPDTPTVVGAMNQSDYLIQLHKTCAPLNEVDTQTNPTQGTPFACH